MSSTYNQTDFILTPERFKSRFNKANTRTFPGVDIGSDHDFVLTIIKCKSQRFKKSFRIRVDLENLKDPNMSEVFQAKVGRKFLALCVLGSDVDTLANSLKEVLLSTDEEVMGRQRKKIQSLVTNEVLCLCDHRRQLKQQKYTSTKAGPEYRKKGSREVRKKMKSAKEE